MKKKWILGVSALALCLIILVAAIVNQSPAGASTSDQVIVDTFENLQVSDTQYKGIYEFEGESYLQYFSESNNTEYCFDPVTGRLEVVTNWNTISTDGEKSFDIGTEVLTDEERQEMVLEYVADCYGSSLIGEMTIEKEDFNNKYYTYTIREYYNDMETGSSAKVYIYADGTIKGCNLKYGSVFQKTGVQTAALSSDDEYIPQEDAIQIAVDYVTPMAEEKGYIVLEDTIQSKVSAREDDVFYRVEIETVEDKESDPYTVIYVVWVDVYDGEILFYQFTQ